VHPVSGDIVFDMAGDVYCLPADAYLGATGPVDGRTEAVPVLTGVPHDADPYGKPDHHALLAGPPRLIGKERRISKLNTYGNGRSGLRTPPKE
jgi:hypothetical protein